MNPKRKKTNIMTVAEAAGTSAMTVTRALNNSGRIAPETRERILKIAKELNYQPSFFARGMRGRRTRSVGIIMSMGDSQPINVKARTITSRLHQAGYSAYIADSFSDAGEIARVLEDFTEKKVDALFFQTDFTAPLEDKRVRELLSNIPCVLIESYWEWDLPFDQLRIDRDTAMRQMAAHFCSAGRKRPVLIAAEGEGTSERIRLFKDVMRKAGIRPPEKMLAALEQGAGKLPLEGELYVEALRRSFPDLSGFDSIWCARDEGAAAVVRFLSDNGVRVPEDVAVAGYNNSGMSAYLSPPLASVDTCFRQAAELAADMLFDRLKNSEKPIRRERITLPFVRRESAG